MNRIYISDGIVVVCNKIENKCFLYDKSRMQKYNVNEDLIELLNYINDNPGISMEKISQMYGGIEDTIEKMRELGIICDERQFCTSKIKTIEKLDTARIFVECTSKCNLSCPHCYGAFCAKNTEEIRIEDIERLIRKAADIGVYEVDITGGEPFLHTNIERIFQILYENSMITTLFTNLTACSKHNLDVLKEYGIKTVVTSIESYDHYIHDKFRGVKGALSKTLNSIDYLLDLGLEVKANLVLGEHNIEHTDEIVKYIVGLGIDCNIDVTTPSGRAQGISRTTINKALEILKKYNNGELPKNCGVCKRMIFVASDGKVYPCPSIREPKYCLDTIGDDFEIEKSFATSFNLLNGWICSNNCEVKECSGGCRARALQFGGELKNPDPYYCKIYREREI